jgi:chemotaxis family two-component system sensor kinase Cph1
MKVEVTHEQLPTLPGDGTQIRQLFQNLLANAIKFRSERPPAVHVAVSVDGECWRFTVSDNGIGIDPKYSDRVFVLFQRLHTREEYLGTGIGLALCKKIVERHGGRIWFEPNAGGGTSFVFILPRRIHDEH